MSRSPHRWPWTVHVAILLVIAAPAGAQPPPGGDLLDHTRRTADVAARQVEADVRFALKEAQRFATTDPAKTIDRLTKLLATLNADRVLPAERRNRTGPRRPRSNPRRPSRSRADAAAGSAANPGRGCQTGRGVRQSQSRFAGGGRTAKARQGRRSERAGLPS